MNEVVVLVLLGVIGLGLGFVSALLTRRPRTTLAGGALGVAALTLLYVLRVGEGAPFAPHVVRAGAIAAAAVWAGLASGVWVAVQLERRGRA